MNNLLQRLGCTLLMVLLALPTLAQERTGSITITDSDGSSITIDMRDGLYFYNGTEVTPDDDGRLVIQTEDGERTVFVARDADRSLHAFGDDPEEVERRYRRMLENRRGEFGPDGEDAWRVFFNEDGPARLRSYRMQRDPDAVPRLRDDFTASFGGAPHVFSFDDSVIRGLRGFDEDLLVGQLAGPMDEATREARREIQGMEREAQTLAREVRRASGQERAEKEAELRDHLAELFEKKMALRAQALDRLEARLEEERATFDERRSMHDRIIERRLSDLLGERDLLDW